MPSRHPILGAARLIQRLLLLAYPRGFRQEYGTAFAEDYRELSEAVFRKRGWRGLLRLQFQAGLDTIFSAMTEHGVDRSLRERFGQLMGRRRTALWERGVNMSGSIGSDFRYGLRSLIKRPAFTLAVVVTLALGIGANTALFSVVYSALLQELPFPHSERLTFFTLRTHGQPAGNRSLSPIFYREFSGREGIFEQSAAWFTRNYNLTGAGDPLRLRGARISQQLFPLLGVEMTLGRGFQPQEDVNGAGQVTILSHGLWQSRFGGDSSILGQSIQLDGVSCLVVGVAPSGFDFPLGTDLWTPLALAPVWYGEDRRGWEFLSGLGLLQPGLSTPAAEEALSSLVEQTSQRRYQRGTRAFVQPLQQRLVGDRDKALYLLLGAVGLVLLIGCANVTNLLLVRSESRRRELALRMALGSGRDGLLRLMLAESVLLGAAGGLAGLALAWGGIQILAGLNPIPFVKVGLDGGVLLFALAVTASVCLIFSLGPAWKAWRSGLQGALREGGPSSSPDQRSGRAGGLLAGAEVALALVLLIGVGIALQSFRNLLSVDPGFRPQGVVTLRLELPSARYPTAKRFEFFQALQEQVQGLPGVQAAGWTSGLPLGGTISNGSYYPKGEEPDEGQEVPNANLRNISPGYFRTLSIPLLEGRDFGPQDRSNAPMAVIVDQALARRHWPNRSPLGEEVVLAFLDQLQDAAVVGLVGNVKDRRLDSDAAGHLYLPLAQIPARAASLAVRTEGNPSNWIPALRRQVEALDADLPIYGVRTLDEQVRQALSVPRQTLILLSLFGVVALILALAGVYGVTAYNVSRRVGEIGIRMALGASRQQVFGQVVGRAMLFWLAGTAAGCLAAFALRGAASNLAFQVSPSDPLTFAAVALCMGGVTFLSALLPARRAARIDSANVLRHE